MIGDTVPIPTATGTSDTPWYTQLLRSATETYGQYLTLQQQRELLRIQNQRAAAGLPPLDVSQYTPGVNVGLASDTQRTLLMVAGGLGVLWLASKVFK
jgi:hypothetical protein